MHPKFLICSCLMLLPLLPKSARCDEISTPAGERLTGQILSFGPDGVVFQHAMGQQITIPLANLKGGVAKHPLAITLHNGDRVTGPVEFGSDGKLLVHSSLLGDMTIPVTTITSANALASGSVVAEMSSPPQPTTNLLSSPKSSKVIGRGALEAQQTTLSEPKPSDNKSTDDEGSTTKQIFLRDTAVTLENRNIEFDLLAGLIRNRVTGQAVTTDDTIFTLAGSLRANLLPGFEGFVTVPFQSGWRKFSFSIVSEPQDTSSTGIGDVRFGFKYQLLPEAAAYPGIYLNVAASAPTGKYPYLNFRGQPANLVPTDPRNPFTITLGSGHWAATGGFSIVRSYDPIVLFGGFDYTHFFAETFYGVTVQPGDRYGYNFGLGFNISEYSTLGALVFGSFDESWRFNSKKVENTSSYPVSLRLSYTHRLSPKDFLEPSVLFGLTSDSTSAILNLSYTRRF